MNILVPDSWLRKFLKTKATPLQLKEYLSLCGPSIERIYEDSGEPVYDVEITTNRPDAMSVFGIAREAAVILPQFGVPATLVNNPYATDFKGFSAAHRKEASKKLAITSDATLNPRWTSMVMTNVSVKTSPKWLQDWLTRTGIRPINTIVDITNYLMRAYGQPAHAFDYDTIEKKNGVPTMKLRASKKGEKLVTLDGKSHSLPGDDIVIEDGRGRLIDLCGIMGGENSAIRDSTSTIVLFLQTYKPVHIRKTSMRLAHRTEAAGLFEKGVDSELVLPALIEGIRLISDIAGGTIASRLYDLYPKPFVPYTVSVRREKIDRYLGVTLEDKTLASMLTALGFVTRLSQTDITVGVPSFRRDITIDVDIIEEIARIYGYHRIPSKLPEGEPPDTLPDPMLVWEEELKTRLRNWGYTELYTYSMLSETQMNSWGLDTKKSYKIANPLSEDWLYMRPKLWPSVVEAVKQNLNVSQELHVFEMSMVYEYRQGDLPRERPALMVAWSGHHFSHAKGLAEAIFTLFGIPFPDGADQKTLSPHTWNDRVRLTLGDYGSVSEINKEMLDKLGVNQPVTMLSLYMDTLVKNSQPGHVYEAVSLHPAVMEDLSFLVPERFEVGPLMNALKKAHHLVRDVTLLDVHQNTRTLHVTYQDPKKNLTTDDVAPVRKKLITLANEKFGVTIKS